MAMSPQTIHTVDEIELIGPISTAMLRNLPRATAIGRLVLTQAKGAPYPGQKITDRARFSGHPCTESLLALV